ncbi:uncharacterized protein AAES06_022430 isoform 1-T2 [Glossophaga mutica]
MELRARCRGRGRARQGLDTEWEYLDEAQEQLRHSARTQGPGPCARARELAPTRGLPPPPLTERGEERKKERKRNITLCLPLMCPLLETWPETQACAVTWNQTGDPFVHRLLLSSHQPVLFKICILPRILEPVLPVSQNFPTGCSACNPAGGLITIE